MKCPGCGAENSQRLEVAYQGGTSIIETTSRSSSSGASFGGTGAGLWSGSSTTETSGTSQTKLAARASPPEKSPYFPWVITFIIAYLVIGFAGRKHWGWTTLGVIVMVACVAACFFSYRFNRMVWPGRYKNWLESWVCHACGKIFHQSDAAG